MLSQHVRGTSLLDRIADVVNKFCGSMCVFIGITTGIVLWLFLGNIVGFDKTPGRQRHIQDCVDQILAKGRSQARGQLTIGELMDRSRLEAFSDGVFAVAITLLALDLTVEGPADMVPWSISSTTSGRPSWPT